MFTKDVYSGRRATLKKMISKGIAFFPANNEAPFNYPDNTYIYRQDSNFSYYFGLNHPDLVGVIDFESGEEILATSTISENTSSRLWPKAVRSTCCLPTVATHRFSARIG